MKKSEAKVKAFAWVFTFHTLASFKEPHHRKLFEKFQMHVFWFISWRWKYIIHAVSRANFSQTLKTPWRVAFWIFIKFRAYTYTYIYQVSTMFPYYKSETHRIIQKTSEVCAHAHCTTAKSFENLMICKYKQSLSKYYMGIGYPFYF